MTNSDDCFAGYGPYDLNREDDFDDEEYHGQRPDEEITKSL